MLVVQPAEERVLGAAAAGGPRTGILSARLLAVALFGFLTGGSQAETITGVTIDSVSSELISGFNRQANFLVDGSGLDEVTGFHTIIPDGFMWAIEASSATALAPALAVPILGSPKLLR